MIGMSGTGRAASTVGCCVVDPEGDYATVRITSRQARAPYVTLVLDREHRTRRMIRRINGTVKP
jgi:hypothetical protein